MNGNGRGRLELPGQAKVALKKAPGENANAVGFSFQTGPQSVEWVVVGGVPQLIQVAAMCVPAVAVFVDTTDANYAQQVAARSMDIATAIYDVYAERQQAAYEQAQQAAKDADTPGQIIQEP